jgi:hypothetical protein
MALVESVRLGSAHQGGLTRPPGHLAPLQHHARGLTSISEAPSFGAVRVEVRWTTLGKSPSAEEFWRRRARSSMRRHPGFGFWPSSRATTPMNTLADRSRVLLGEREQLRTAPTMRRTSDHPSGERLTVAASHCELVRRADSIAFCRPSALQSRPDPGRGNCLQSFVSSARDA